MRRAQPPQAGRRSRSLRTRSFLRWITRRLVAAHGTPRHGNPEDPIDDLVYLLLSRQTQATKFTACYNALKAEFPTWRVLACADTAKVASIIAWGGLGQSKAAAIVGSLRRILDDFGEDGLDALRAWPAGVAEHYLASLPGVGVKIARCVMMYTFGFSVFPVDAHVGRTAWRLRLVDSPVPSRAEQNHLQELVAPEDRYALHVAMVAHGRAICRARVPRCEICPLASRCPSATTAGGTRSGSAHHAQASCPRSTRAADARTARARR